MDYNTDSTIYDSASPLGLGLGVSPGCGISVFDVLA
jgi:hypothetical protein